MAAASRAQVAMLVVLALAISSAQDRHQLTSSPFRETGTSLLSTLRSKRNPEHPREAISFRDAIHTAVVDDDTDVKTQRAKNSEKYNSDAGGRDGRDVSIFAVNLQEPNIRDHRQRRSVKQDSTSGNRTSASDDSSQNPTSRQTGSNYPGKMIVKIQNKVREIIPRFLKNILAFVQIYRGLLSRYSPTLMTELHMPSLENEISRSEDLDYSMNSGTSSDLPYRITKGKRLAEFYSYKVNELLRMIRTGNKRTNDVYAAKSTGKADSATGEARAHAESGALDFSDRKDKHILRKGSDSHGDGGHRRNSNYDLGISDDSKRSGFSPQSLYSTDDGIDADSEDDMFSPITDDVLERLYKDNEYFRAMPIGASSHNTLHNADHFRESSDMSARIGPADVSDAEVDTDSADINEGLGFSLTTSSLDKDVGLHESVSDKVSSNRSSLGNSQTSTSVSEETVQTDNGNKHEATNLEKTASNKTLTDKSLQETNNTSSRSVSLPENKILNERAHLNGQKGNSFVTNKFNAYSDSKVPNYAVSKPTAQSFYGRGRPSWAIRGKRETNSAVNSEEERVGSTMKENTIADKDNGPSNERLERGLDMRITRRAVERVVGVSRVPTVDDNVNGDKKSTASKDSTFYTIREKRADYYGSRWEPQSLRTINNGGPMVVNQPNRGNFKILSGSPTARRQLKDAQSVSWLDSSLLESGSVHRKPSTGLYSGTGFPSLQNISPSWTKPVGIGHSTDKVNAKHGSDSLFINRGSLTISSVDMKWLMDNVMEAAALVNEISVLLHQIYAILPPNMQSATAYSKTSQPELSIQQAKPANEGANEFSSTDLKAQMSINTVFSDYVSRVNEILQAYSTNEAINYNQEPMLLLALAQHRLLNTLLYKNLANLASRLDGTSNMLPPSHLGTYRDQTPIPTGPTADILMPRMLKVSEMKDEENSTATTILNTFQKTDVNNGSEEETMNNDLENRMFSTEDTAQTSGNPTDISRSPKPPFPQYSGSFGTNAAIRYPGNSRFHNTPYPQKKPWQSWGSPFGYMHSYHRNLADLTESTDGNSNVMEKVTEEEDVFQDKPLIMEEDKLKFETAIISDETQLLQNSPDNVEDLSFIKELLDSVGIDNKQFSEEDIQKIFIMTTKIANDTLRRYAESQTSAGSDSSRLGITQPCTGSTSQKTDITKHLASEANKDTPENPLHGARVGGEGKLSLSKEPLTAELIRFAAPSMKFLHSKSLLKKLRSNEIRSFCKALVAISGRDVRDWQNSRDSFSAVVAEYILALYDSGVNEPSVSYQTGYQKYRTGHTRSRRNDAVASLERDSEYDKLEPRFSQSFTDPNAAFNTFLWDARNSATLELQRLIYSNAADPIFYRSFFKYCQLSNSGSLKCTPLGAEYRGNSPKEMYLVLKNFAIKTTIPQSCPPLFGIHQS